MLFQLEKDDVNMSLMTEKAPSPTPSASVSDETVSVIEVDLPVSAPPRIKNKPGKEKQKKRLTPHSMNGYKLFCRDEIRKIRASSSGEPVAGMNKELGQRWKALDEAEQLKYKRDAAKIREESLAYDDEEFIPRKHPARKRKARFPSFESDTESGGEVVVEPVDPLQHQGATCVKKVTMYYYRDPHPAVAELEKTKKELQKVTAESAERDKYQKAQVEKRKTALSDAQKDLEDMEREKQELKRQIADLRTKCENSLCPSAIRIASYEKAQLGKQMTALSDARKNLENLEREKHELKRQIEDLWAKFENSQSQSVIRIASLEAENLELRKNVLDEEEREDLRAYKALCERMSRRSSN